MKPVGGRYFYRVKLKGKDTPEIVQANACFSEGGLVVFRGPHGVVLSLDPADVSRIELFSEVENGVPESPGSTEGA